MILPYLVILLTLSAVCSDELAYPACYIQGEEKCSIDFIHTPSWIFPGGQSHCAYDTNKWWGFDATYRFRYIPGIGEHKQNLLIYFAGGGACFNRLTCSMSLLKLTRYFFKDEAFFENAEAGFVSGVFNRTNPANTFQKYSIIEFPSCTGDGHLGTKIHKEWFKKFYHNGAFNVEEGLKWVYTQFPDPNKLVIMGSSSGALAAQAWAGRIINDYRKKHKSSASITVLGDSYIGVAEAQRQGELMHRWGACDANIGLTREMKRKCVEGKLSFQDIVLKNMQEHPDAAFGLLHAARDESQKLFYCIMEKKYFQLKSCIKDDDFKAKVEIILHKYLEHLPQKNLGVYILDDTIHVYTARRRFYTVGVKKNISPKMNQWVKQLVSHEKLKNECDEGTCSSFVEEVVVDVQ